MQTAALQGGFTDAAPQSARAFRVAMQAMARPGKRADRAGAQPPAPLSVAAGTLLLTLSDPETPLHLAGAHDCAAVRDWIAFHTGAPIVDAGRAMFALGTWDALQPLSAYSHGRPDYPDRSATLIVEMDRLASEGATLRGPGIKDSARLSLPDIPALQANARGFPLGLDFFFTCGDRVAGLPRSTQVEAG